LLLGVMTAPRVFAQNGGPYFHGTMQQPIGQPGLAPAPSNGGDGNFQMDAKRLEALNADRQRSMVADTDKLVKLAAKLNAQINGAHPVALSDAQLRMVAEIEKLAHSIREKMTTPVGRTPGMGPSALPIPVPLGMD